MAAWIVPVRHFAADGTLHGWAYVETDSPVHAVALLAALPPGAPLRIALAVDDWARVGPDARWNAYEEDIRRIRQIDPLPAPREPVAW